jgi:hypothetical protein
MKFDEKISISSVHLLNQVKTIGILSLEKEKL